MSQQIIITSQRKHNKVSEYRQEPNRPKRPETKKTEPIHEVSDPAWVRYLLVSSVVELHEVTTLKILGNGVCRTSSPKGVSTETYWQARRT